ncbi:chromatin-remodeling ATPase INO80-like [Asterias rubens]|uniref:chromatin-remodeling ATPase INO80-like n=1 Tax=Asterias rubens TaxID=7604 RepID=UPI001454F94D|nr:chromatin-remodeling ATPase INO80-like [Asterias rubens]
MVSVGSETNRQSHDFTPVPYDDNSNDGLVIADEQSGDMDMDDPAKLFVAGKRGPSKVGKTIPSTSKKVQPRPMRSRKNTGAAAIAGARAGAVAGTAAAYAAYGFSFTEKSS